MKERLLKINPLLVGSCGILLFTMWHLSELYTNGYNLFFDEAQYWDWARNIDWGYFSKPPFIAWAITASSEMCGSTEACIRLPSPIAHMLTALALMLLGNKLFSPKIGMWTGLTYITLIGVSFSSLLISTDPFLLCFWAWGLLFLAHALETDKIVWWILLGVSLGLGFLSKYAMLFFPLSLLVFLLWRGEAGKMLKNPKLWLALGIGLLILIPNLYWNYINSFVTFNHTKDNANLGNFGLHPLQMLEFVGSQFGVFGPILLAVLLIMAMKIKKCRDERFKFLLSFCLPVLLIMVGEALFSRAHANWAATAYVAGTLAVVAWLYEKKKSNWIKISLLLHVVIAALLYTEAYAIIGDSRLDPMRRAKGWDYAAMQVSTIMEQNADAVLMTDERKVLTPLLFYVVPQPEKIYKWNSAQSIRDHYDLTAGIKSLKNPENKNFVLVSRLSDEASLKPYFAKVDKIKEIEINIYDDYKIKLNVFKLSNFKGF